jgi:xanthine dehydrogenase accessory factor
MDTIKILRSAAATLEGGGNIALVTVTSANGSTPGKVGQKMLLARDGVIAGTVGGGWVEARLMDEAHAMLDSPGCRLLQFDLGQLPDDDAGICGGSVEFLIETFDPTAAPLFRDIVTFADRDDTGMLVSLIASDGLPRKACWRENDPTPLLDAARLSPQLLDEVLAAAKNMSHSHAAGLKISMGECTAFVELLCKPPTLILCGAGHLAFHVARYAHETHFRVVVCDDRSAYASQERFPDADSVLVEDLTCVLDRVKVNDQTYVVIVTRGHKSDEAILQQALQTPARYIGMIGSRRKTQTVLKNLEDNGIARTALNRVYAPIGLSIGAVTVEEIALSIVCELVKVRRLGDEAPVGHMSLSRRKEVR